MNRCRNLLVGVSLALAHHVAAQVTAPIVLGVTGSSRAQPGIAVLAGRGLDSVRVIVQRDLLNSDQFTVSLLTDSLGTLPASMDSTSFRGLTGFTWIVELQPSLSGVVVKLWDVATGSVRQQATDAVDLSGVGDRRITIHRVSDQVVNWTGGIGIAATRIAFKMKNGAEDAIWRIDGDGANPARVSRSDRYEFTPAWSPDGATIAYSEYADGRKVLYMQRLATGTRTAITSMAPGDAYGGNFSNDGRYMVFTYAGSTGGSLIATADVVQNCCAHELTHDHRNADNVSPAYSPDGRHIAYISNRTGTPQIWVMDNDGLNDQPQVPPDFDDHGRALDTYSPAWSPDGTKIAFARDKGGVREIWLWSVGGGQAVQLTSHGRNEDPSWAPDSRHLVFKSWQTGREQLWVYDIVTFSSRQLNTPGGAQYPAWSHVLGLNP